MNRIGVAAAALTAVLYGSAYVAVAIALDAFTPVGVAVWRGIVGALVLGALVLGALVVAPDRERPRRPSSAAAIRLGVIGLLGGGVFVLAMIAAVDLAGATVTAVVAGLYAVSAALLAIPLLGERPAARTAAALVAALVGTVLLSDVWSGGQTPAGVAMALVAAVAFGLFLVLSRRWASTYGLSGPVVGVVSLAVSAVASIAVAAVAGDDIGMSEPSLPALVAVGWLALGPGAAATVLAVAAMRRLRAEQAAPLLLLNPPTAAILAFVLLGERLDALQLVGAVLTFTAIAVATVGLPTRTAFRRNSRRGSAPPPRS